MNLIQFYRLKKFAKERGVRLSEKAGIKIIEWINSKVDKMLKNANELALINKRKTVLERDIKAQLFPDNGR